ncbi:MULTISPECIES: YchJ family protein [Pasteurellaceae]|uniref:YchJ family protein n=1 Tax=Pasteurella atlantica TaxID=2827233 RepID=A0AAW8CJ32_9PAST|nr:YchJ family protein [Pasteurella atlantica]MBR0574081.1 YchJ family protein [Pasteurella atlantica]MDP8040095.1 YchJ family protein [Pasteurella atlantica]MDP8042208.1 YchJ family protein [Pasteurella atlantica]MDP8044385.1 YchJ family protein [Pasteurella atlantica]MDP8046367.1 YchJ family protein [Pasteurella atlantica]
MNHKPCPCQSNKSYAECCEPFHQHIAKPLTAEQLMRSRYSAYTLININYIVETTLPSQQKHLDKSAMEQWAKMTKWCGLEIVAHNPTFAKNRATVEFKAYFKTEQKIAEHHELSLFIYKGNKWYFVDPNV